MNQNYKAILFTGDIVALLIAFTAMLCLGFGWHWNSVNIHAHILPFSILGITWLVVSFICNLYEYNNISLNVRNTALFGSVVLSTLLIGVFMFYGIVAFGIAPKSNLIIFLITAAIVIIGYRRALRLTLLRGKPYEIAMFSDAATYETFERDAHGHLTISRITRHDDMGQLQRVINELLVHLRPGSSKLPLLIIDEVTGNNHHNHLILLAQTMQHGLPITTSSEVYQSIIGRIPVTVINYRLIERIFTRSQRNFYTIMKRILDIILSFIALVISLPLILISGIFITIDDRGPWFYSHMRVGLHGKPFRFTKLRSMRTDAESNGAVWAEQRDPRVTRVGKVIRKLHIDELPQMWSVLRGDMSLVGPRPERPEFVKQLEQDVPYYYLRHLVKPGFTGWAQIKFRYARSVLDSQTKFEYDLYYILHRNLFLDIGIILKTIQIIFTH